jgi:DNA-binding PadR family transcriptional regulator
MSSRRLTPTSYAVLGLLAQTPGTSYDLVARVRRTIGNFWIFSHAQLYAEPARLEARRYVASVAEEGGRRRRVYTITEAGRAELKQWLAQSTPGHTEVRDPGLLKLFFADQGDPGTIAALARDRRSAHAERAAAYEGLQAVLEGIATPGQVATLELGVRMERTIAQFWEDLLSRPDS